MRVYTQAGCVHQQVSQHNIFDPEKLNTFFLCSWLGSNSGHWCHRIRRSSIWTTLSPLCMLLQSDSFFIYLLKACSPVNRQRDRLDSQLLDKKTAETCALAWWYRAALSEIDHMIRNTDLTSWNSPRSTFGSGTLIWQQVGTLPNRPQDQKHWSDNKLELSQVDHRIRNTDLTSWNSPRSSTGPGTLMWQQVGTLRDRPQDQEHWSDNKLELSHIDHRIRNTDLTSWNSPRSTTGSGTLIWQQVGTLPDRPQDQEHWSDKLELSEIDHRIRNTNLTTS